MDNVPRTPASGISRSTCSDLDAMKRFYVDLLGFAVEWEPDADNVYLSSGIDNLALHRSTPLAQRGRGGRAAARAVAARSSRADRADAGRRRSVGGVSREPAA